MRLCLFLFAFFAFFGCEKPTGGLEETADYSKIESSRFAKILSPLLDPNKLDKLAGKRAATPRLRKACYWLEMARREGADLSTLIDQSYGLAPPQETAREEEQKVSLLRNITILERLGCFDKDGMAKLRKGNAPTIQKGPYAGELATVDHIIPRSVCLELDNAIFNLEFLPDSLNRKKSAKIGGRQISLASKWHSKKLLSREGYLAIIERSKDSQ